MRTKKMKIPNNIASVRDEFLLAQTLFRQFERGKGRPRRYDLLFKNQPNPTVNKFEIVVLLRQT